MLLLEADVVLANPRHRGGWPAIDGNGLECRVVLVCCESVVLRRDACWHFIIRYQVASREASHSTESLLGCSSAMPRVARVEARSPQDDGSGLHLGSGRRD